MTLDCNHHFHYDCLFQEVRSQKSKHHKYHNNMETTYLAIHQMKCPYCRHVNNYLLPPPPSNSKFSIERGVNSPAKYCRMPFTCEYKFRMGMKKGQECGKRCTSSMCDTHLRMTERLKNKNEQKNKKKASKMSEKYTKMVLRPRRQHKTNSDGVNTIPEENTIIPQTIPITSISLDPEKCQHILMKGKRKGLQCARKGSQGGFCFQHGTD